MSKIEFNKLVNQNIFSSDFTDFCENNVLEFSNEGVCVVYAPNGTGKTSLIKTLNKNTNTEYKLKIDNIEYSTSDSALPFFIIEDQNNRNIIAGETSDFLIGDNIKKEYELEKQIALTMEKIKLGFCNEIKSKFFISSASSQLINLIKDPNLKSLVKDLSNSRSKGSNYDAEKLISLFSTVIEKDIPDYSEDKLKYMCQDFASKNSILQKVLDLKSSSITINEEIGQIEENTEAIKILKRFPHVHKCVVCDSDGINTESQVEKKENNRERIVNTIDDKLKEMINQLIDMTFDEDIFNIKEILVKTISTGDIVQLDNLKREIKAYEELYEILLRNEFLVIYKDNNIESIFADYKKLINEKPEIDQEDLLYIQGIVNDSMSKPLRLDRDKNKNIKIYLSDKEFIGKDRTELPLSTGEQNFLSLTFEFLKAKKNNDKIIVIDDPISSFDSIYKNKIVYSLIKILNGTNRLILTHNLDLVRLINAQYKDCFNLYILNNVNGDSQNGFIKLNKNEQKILINLKELIILFKADIFSHIEDAELYLISMIPFMRGYSGIIGKEQDYEKLTNLMHGYKTEKVDVVSIYTSLFGDNGKSILPEKYEINVEDILRKNFDSSLIIRDYPLLNKTLRHSAIYLSLRLLVEKTLVAKYQINTEEKKQLGQIISAAFPNQDDKIQMKRRVAFTSKKTLINEFNHFEGNLSIFQPAIDITESALSREKTQILQLVESIRNEKDA